MTVYKGRGDNERTIIGNQIHATNITTVGHLFKIKRVKNVSTPVQLNKFKIMCSRSGREKKCVGECSLVQDTAQTSN